MKKSSKNHTQGARKLRFDRETLRSLAAVELDRVAGGLPSACNDGCVTCAGSISCPHTK